MSSDRDNRHPGRASGSNRNPTSGSSSQGRHSTGAGVRRPVSRAAQLLELEAALNRGMVRGALRQERLDLQDRRQNRQVEEARRAEQRRAAEAAEAAEARRALEEPIISTIQQIHPRLTNYKHFAVECTVTNIESKQEKDFTGADKIVNYIEFDGPYLNSSNVWERRRRSGLKAGRQGSSLAPKKGDRFLWRPITDGWQTLHWVLRSQSVHAQLG